jgi:perosamine synthetase
VKELICVAPKHVEVHERNSDSLPSSGLRLKTILSGVAHGTEMKIFNGSAISGTTQFNESKRLFEERSSSKYPVRLGYETVGQIIEVGDSADQSLLGRTVWVDAHHATEHVIQARSNVIVLPDSIQPEEGIFLAYTRVALCAVHDSEMIAGDVVCVTGCGVLGQLLIQVAFQSGASRVYAVDVNGARLELAAGFGAIPLDASRISTIDLKSLISDDIDVAFEASGSEDGLLTSVRLVRVGGRVVIASTFDANVKSGIFHSELLRNRVTLTPSMSVNGVPHRKTPWWNLDRLNREALRLLADGVVSVSSLTTKWSSIEDAQSLYTTIAEGNLDFLRGVFDYSASEPTRNIPPRFLPYFEEDINVLKDAIRIRKLSGTSPTVVRYEEELCKYFSSKSAVAVSSGTAAIAAALSALGATDRTVLVPASAPLPAILPIFAAGARPLLIDSGPQATGFSMDELRKIPLGDVSAAVVVHTWGYPAENLLETCEYLSSKGIPLIEDVSHAHGATLHGQLLGTFGSIGCFSTHDHKMLATGEGGFLICPDETLAEEIRSFCSLRYLSGEKQGVNYKLSGTQAAIGLSRLPKLDWQIQCRRRNLLYLVSELQDLPISLIASPRADGANGYNLVFYLPNSFTDSECQWAHQYLSNHNIQTDQIRYGYRVASDWKLLKGRFSQLGPFSQSEIAIPRTIQLPTHPGLKATDIKYIAVVVRDMLKQVTSKLVTSKLGQR